MSRPEQTMTTPGLSVTISIEIMAAVAVVFLVVFFLMFFFYLRAKQSGGGADPTLPISRSDNAAGLRRGLDPAVIRALPITVFRSDDFKDGLECSVCLSELTEGKQARLLPKCNHGFHLDCIDMWFQSNSTCPLCRSPVRCDPFRIADSGTQLMDLPPVEEVSGDGNEAESVNLPANLLFWGIGDRSSSSAGSSSGKLVVDIPRGAAEGLTSPTLSRLRSLRTLLSLGGRGVGSPCSPVGGDIVDGGAGAGGTVDGSSLVPRTPTSS